MDEKKAKKSKSKAPNEDPEDSTALFEQALAQTGQNGTYVLRLYVTGLTPCSQRAITNVRKLCQEHLPGRHELEIIDIYQQPGLAREEQLLAAPTLIRKLPLPLRKLLGDLSDPGRVLLALGLKVDNGEVK